MTGIIHKLTDDLIPKIAAGEVADSPAAIVKELVENSLDAGATKIIVEITNSGFSSIRIVDDGVGMSHEDLDKCFQPFYTSKLHEFNDLSHIHTFGFRGEALSSIGSVSSLTIKSRTKENVTGNSIKIDNGTALKSAEIGMNVGTIIEVGDLYKSVPARLKFFKDKSIEFDRILDTLIPYVICYTNVSFKLFRDGNSVFSVADTDICSRIAQLLGLHDLIPVSETVDRFKLSGYITKPQFAHPTVSKSYFFVNRRYVNNKELLKSVVRGYGTLLPHGVYPPYVLFMDIDPSLVDVNVHPKKTNVAFWDTSYVESNISDIVKKSLSSTDLTYVIDSYEDNYRYDKHAEADTYLRLKDSTNLWNPSKIEYSLYDNVFQINNTYIATPITDGLLLVDQHAAHESILFEDIYNSYITKKLKSEAFSLDNPVTLSFTPSEASKMISNLQYFTDLGFSIYQVGPQEFKLDSVPVLFKGRNAALLIKDLLAEFSLDTLPSEIDLRTRKTLEFLSCRSAIKAGDFMSHEEMVTMLKKLDLCNNLYACPHGRPIKIIVKRNELARMFKRIK